MLDLDIIIANPGRYLNLLGLFIWPLLRGRMNISGVDILELKSEAISHIALAAAREVHI